MKKFILALMILAILVPGFAGSVPDFSNNPCFAAAVQYTNAVNDFNLCVDANWMSPTGRWLTDDQIWGYDGTPCYWQNIFVGSAHAEVQFWCNFEQ